MVADKTKAIRTRLSEIWIDEEDILHVQSFTEGELDLSEAKQAFEIYTSLGINSNNRKLQLLDLTIPITITKEARDYIESQGVNYFKACAVIGDSLAIRIIVNFMAFFRPEIPLKMFGNKEAALEWLKKMGKR